jgi:hypothetical protein
MTTKHAFADESARSGYLVCVVVLTSADIAEARQVLKSLRKAGQQRIHMTSESPRRRREILSAVCGLDASAYLYQADLHGRSQRGARDGCLRAAVPELVSLGVGRLVVESCDQDHQDRQVIREMVEKAQVLDDFNYEHGRPSTEPLLWLPDIVAWAYGRGGDWRRRTQQIVCSVQDVAP